MIRASFLVLLLALRGTYATDLEDEEGMVIMEEEDEDEVLFEEEEAEEEEEEDGEEEEEEEEDDWALIEVEEKDTQEDDEEEDEDEHEEQDEDEEEEKKEADGLTPFEGIAFTALAQPMSASQPTKLNQPAALQAQQLDIDDSSWGFAADPAPSVPAPGGDCELPACAHGDNVFYDMIHSNNAARARLLIRLYITEATLPICMVTYADMRCPWFKEKNPNQKVPAMIITTGNKTETLYESNVILEYLVDKYQNVSEKHQEGRPDFKHRIFDGAQDLVKTAKINLMARVHDLYIASPNCNQAKCTHSQGALYLPPNNDFDNTGGRRAILPETRSLKLKELWERWTWLDGYSTEVAGTEAKKYLAGDFLTIADLCFFPTAVFMEFLLPHTAGWPTIFADVSASTTITAFTADAATWDKTSTGWPANETWAPPDIDDGMKATFPKLTKWYPELLKIPVFRKVRNEILSFWVNQRHLDTQWANSGKKSPAELKAENATRLPRFPPIIDEINSFSVAYQWKPIKAGNKYVWTVAEPATANASM